MTQVCLISFCSEQHRVPQQGVGTAADERQHAAGAQRKWAGGFVS